MDKLKLLLNVTTELANEKDLKKILVILTNTTKTLLNADICSIFLHDKKRRELWSIVAYYIDEIRIPDEAGIAGSVFQTGEMINIRDAYHDARFDQEIDRKIGYKTRTILAIPLMNSQEDSIGVIEVINKLDGTSFSQEDIDLLKHITLYVNSIIENATLYEELKRTQEVVVFKLTNLTRYKDPETQNHIVRVGLYAELIATRLQLPRSDVDLIRLAAPMHDIGKIGIPDAILLKPDRLNEEEWKIMKTHSGIGYNILKGEESRLSEMAASIALEHHERWDGKGYPDGKKEREISIQARITTIADVFDALTSRRPYKKEWDYELTRRYIESNQGLQFDPLITSIFLEHYDKVISIKESYSD
jgi:HD-GYP domain-containing protein (c-di-GMP phosphodiesterase class II)